MPFSSKLLNEIAKVFYQLFHVSRHSIHTENADGVWNFNSIDASGDDAVPQSIEITSVPGGSADHAKKCIIKIIPGLPCTSIQSKFPHAASPSFRKGKHDILSLCPTQNMPPVQAGSVIQFALYPTARAMGSKKIVGLALPDFTISHVYTRFKVVQQVHTYPCHCPVLPRNSHCKFLRVRYVVQKARSRIGRGVAIRLNARSTLSLLEPAVPFSDKGLV